MSVADRLRSFSGQHSRISWAAADQGVVSLCNFLSTYLLARFLDITDFGVYSVAYVALLFLNSIQSAAITQPHNVLAASRDRGSYQQFTGILTVVQLAAAIGSALLIIVGGIVLRRFLPAGYGDITLALGLAAGPWMGQEFIRRILYTRSRSRAAFLNDGISYILQLAGILWLVLVLDSPSSSAALLILGGSSAIASVVGVWQLRHDVAMSWSRVEFWSAIAEVREFGRWLVGRNLLAWFGQYGSIWLILGILGPTALGASRAAVHLVNVLNPIRLLVTSYLPSRASIAFATRDKAQLSRVMRSTLFWAGVPFVVVVAGLVVFSDLIIEVAYGNKYDGWPVASVLAIAAMAAVVQFTTNVLEIGLMAMRYSKYLFVNTVIYSLLLLTVGVALIQRFGIVGASLASLAIGSTVAVLVYVEYRRGSRTFTIPGTLARRFRPDAAEAARGPNSE